MRLAPVTAAALAAAWCVAEVLGSAPVAATVAVAAVVAACATGLRRRRRRRALAAALAVIAAVLAVLVTSLLHHSSGPGALVHQLLIVAILGPLAPLVYALTFEDQPGEDR